MRHPQGLSLAELSRQCRVTTRTMRRYLQEIQREYELDGPRTRGGGARLWRIRSGELPRKVEMRRAQAYALLATRRLFEPLRGSALFDEIELAVTKLLAFTQRPGGRGPNAGLTDTHLEDRFVYLPGSARHYGNRAEALDNVYLAVSELRPLSLRYREDAGPGERLTIHPYALVLYKDALHCIGAIVGREEVRCFGVERMFDTQAVVNERFTLPDDFRVDDYFQGAFGLFKAKGDVRVVIEFDADAAQGLRSTLVHPSQRFTPVPGGGLRLALRVDDALALTGWVLGFGKSARVVEPPELEAAVLEELRETLAAYGKKRPKTTK